MDIDDIKARVKNEIEVLAGSEINDPDQEIFTSGLLDSLNILNIIVFIENEFKIKINPFDINLDTLGSINRICEYIQSRNAT